MIPPFQWKMVFNPDLIKQALEVIFSVNNKKPELPELALMAKQSQGKIIPNTFVFFMHFFSGTKHPREDNPFSTTGLR